MPKDAAILDRIQSHLEEVQAHRTPLTVLMESDFQLGWINLKLKNSSLLDSMSEGDHETLKKRILAHVGSADEQTFIAQNKATGEKYVEKRNAVIDSEQIYAQKFAALSDLEQQLSHEGETSDKASLAAYFVCAYSRLYTNSVRDQAGFAALETAIAIYREQVKTGHLPEALPEGTPADPFSGKPFLYEKKGNHFTLRCQGQDLSKKETLSFEF
jgi:hypothetical protein